MRQVLRSQTSVRDQIQTHQAISQRTLRTNPAKAHKDAYAAYSLSQELENGEIQAESAIQLGRVLYFLARHDSSLMYYSEARNYYEKADNPDRLAAIFNGIANSYQALDSYQESRSYYALALGMRRRMNDSLGIASVFNNLGNNYKAEGQFYTALEYYRRAIEIYEKMGRQIELAGLLSNSSLLYGQLKDYASAKQYLYGALEIQQALGNTRRIIIVLHNLGSILSDQDSLNQAITYFLQVEDSLVETPFIRLAWENQIELGACLRKMGRPDTALEIHQRLLPALRASGEKLREATCLHNLSEDLAALGRYRDAEQVALEAQALSQEISAKPLELETHYCLSQIYPQLNEPQKAFEQLSHYVSLSDSLINEEKSHLILQWKSQYELGKQQAEIEALTQQNENQQTNLQRRNFLAIAMGVAMLGMLILGFLLYRRSQQQRTLNELLEQKVSLRTQELQSTNQLLTQTNQELERFAYLTSHDLKEGVRNVISFLQRLGKRLRYFPDEDAQTYFQFALDGGHHIHSVISGLEELKRLQAHQAKKIQVDPNLLMQEVQAEIQSLTDSKGAQLAWEKLPRLKTDPLLLKSMLIHLCRNGIQFNRSDIPWVNVSSQSHEGQTLIIVQDNGIGINAAYQSQIFDIFQRLQKRDEFPGAGLGLTIVRQAVEKLGGSVWVKSAPGTGSRFYLSFPGSTVA